MPHFHIEYSGNLDGVVDMQALCDAVRQAASLIDAFPTPGIRVRATRVDHFSMADGDPKHAFVDLSVRLRAGRTDAVKERAISQVFEVLKSFMADAMEDNSIALSAEMRDIDPDFSPKFGNVRKHMEQSG